jgi:hypothetical protein
MFERAEIGKEGILTYFKTSSAIISRNSAANSTPVGPPPQMTNDNRRFRSSGVVVGRDANSKLAIYELPVVE